MVSSRKQESFEEGKTEGLDREDQATSNSEGGFDELSSSVISTSSSSSSSSDDDEIGLTERLTEIVVEEGDSDLLIREDRVLQWLQALDLQVMGACRADERLKPLLKLNVSSGIAEDRLMAQLSQHFEASEVGMLARCLCIPLVSIRAGKIIKQGTRMCPTPTRGNLNLTLLPTSDLRISFVGDDGCTERLSTLTNNSQCTSVMIEEIPADNSGRSFLIKVPDGQVFYFWCSEKSRLLGNELLAKMKDLLKRKPSLAELTGISESRLDCFAIHLRAYLGSTMSNIQANSVVTSTSLLDVSLDMHEIGQNCQSSPVSSKFLRTRHVGNQPAKANQASLSPRSSSFKEGGFTWNLSSLRIGCRDKLRRRADNHVLTTDNQSVASTLSSETLTTTVDTNKLLDLALPNSPVSLDPLGKSAALTLGGPIPCLSSVFSPQYCWCPPHASSSQCAMAPAQLPILAAESLPLPPLSSLLPSTSSSSSLSPLPPLDQANIVPALDFPAFLPEPLVRVPFSMPGSQQIPTFTPLICDPIVHIPVIDASGQGYFVSAGPAMSTTIPPLHPKLVSPLIPETDSVVEQGARETLRLLISSSQANPQLMDVLPVVLSNTTEKQSLVVGSRGLYDARDIDAITSSIGAMSLVAIYGSPQGDGSKESDCSKGSSLDHGDSMLSNNEEISE
ncbi:hypothetical protein RJ641_005651 [Dillenia turbinata]|uniref:RNI-like superfamily protein n=1 Tax=Dillenia turbinata TaxID=194707 RepID=A0AAN8Z906_9MAGN